MIDGLNSNIITKQALYLNKKVFEIVELCDRFLQEPSQSAEDNIVQTMIDIDRDIDTIKHEIAKLLNKINGVENGRNDSNNDIIDGSAMCTVKETENGFLISQE